MAWVNKPYCSPLELIPHKTDLNCFRVVKTRQPTRCVECKKKLPKRSYVYGSDWTRLCLECGDKFSYKGIKGFEEVIDYIKANQKRLKENLDKWKAENSLALL